MLYDPTGIESPIKEQKGLGLLDTETTFNEKKTTTQAIAKRDNYILKGYEIHMGTTKRGLNSMPFSTIQETNGQPEKREDGAVSNDGTVIGTYLHGIFDNPYWTRRLLNRLRVAKGMAPLIDTTVSISDYKDQQYEKLAQLFAQNVDMDKFNQILQDSTKE